MNLVVISGSTRRASFNTRLAQLVAEVRPQDSVDVRANLAHLPFYDAEVEAQGFPEPVAHLQAAVAGADGVIFVTPEYNGSPPGVLANALDWLSRPAGQSVLAAKQAVVLSASPSAHGATRAAEHLRGVLSRIGADVAQGGIAVAGAHERLDPARVEEFKPTLAHFLDETLGRSAAAA